jgi:ribosomal protein L16 Arg81 hydroxylase
MMRINMANTKAVSNEQIIAALISCGTVKEAAAAAGTTPRTIYDRMRDKDFEADYMRAKSDLIRGAVFNINNKLSDAINTIADLMQDKEVAPAVRLQAAQTILINAEKFAKRLSYDERQATLKENPFDDIFNF